MNRYTIVGNIIRLEPLNVMMLPNDIPVEVAALAHITRCFYNVEAYVSATKMITVQDAGRELVESLAMLLTPMGGSESIATRATRYVMFRPNLEIYFQAVIGGIGQEAKSIYCTVDGLLDQQRSRLALMLGYRLLSFI